jgi:hypothetical protein
MPLVDGLLCARGLLDARDFDLLDEPRERAWDLRESRERLTEALVLV